MSDPEISPEAAPAANGAAPVAAAPDPKKREEAEKVLTELLQLLELPGRLELKDAADGGIAVALHVEGDTAGLTAGKRSNVVDSLQFLANKIVNKPNQEKRWISIGVGAFPEPRGPRAPRASQPAGPAGAPAPAAAPQQARAPQQPAQPARGPKPAKGGGAPAAAQASRGPSEAELEVTPDEGLAAALRSLAEKSARLGRFYAIAPMKLEDRARALKAAEGVPGVKALVEGEGKLRRVVLAPEKPTPMPKRSAMPDYPVDDDEL